MAAYITELLFTDVQNGYEKVRKQRGLMKYVKIS